MLLGQSVLYSLIDDPVSILTRPGGRVLHGRPAEVLGDREQVSILTRPGGRVLLYTVFAPATQPSVFQSSPAPEGGCCTR